jgi:integrase
MPMSVESVSRRFGQLVERIGMGSVRAHDMRHAYATRLLEAGVHPRSSRRRWDMHRWASRWTPTAKSFPA